MFKAVLPFNDILSDFLVAEQIFYLDYPNTIGDKVKICEMVSMFVYFFIACPGFMILIVNIGVFADKLCGIRCQRLALPVLITLCTIATVMLPFYGDPSIVYALAIFASTCFQLVNFLDILFHGPIMKKISFTMMDYEGRFESAPQLFIQLVMLFSGGEMMEVTALDIYGMCTSLLMLSKDLAESILASTEKYSYSNLSLSIKLSALKKIVPAIMLTVIFRLGTISLAILHIFVFDHFFFLIPLQLFITLPPALTLLWFKAFSPTIGTLSVSECLFGIMGEMTSFNTWGKLRLKESRWIHIGFSIYFNIIYNGICLWTIFYPSKINADRFFLKDNL